MAARGNRPVEPRISNSVLRFHFAQIRKAYSNSFCWRNLDNDNSYAVLKLAEYHLAEIELIVAQIEACAAKPEAAE